MMYQNKLVAAVKVNGKVLRETGDSVTIPFGSEYSLLLKNLDSVRIQVKVSIDGKDATEGTWLIIGPNSSLELERFIRNGNLNSGNKLKFVERTQSIEKHRGIEAEDGLVRIEYKTEKKKPVLKEEVIHHTHTYDYEYWWPYTMYRRPYIYGPCRGNTTTSVDNMQANATGETLKAMNCVRSSMVKMDSSSNDAGITVPGSQSSQQFYRVDNFDTYEQTEVMVLRLKGVVEGHKVLAPVTVHTKKKCSTCGKTDKSNALFCNACGTSLYLI